MSRIYEALQKAESERISEQSEREQQAPESPVEAESPTPTAVAEADYELPAPPPPVERAVRYAPPRASSPVSSRINSVSLKDELDLSQVAKRPWNPAFDQLPALLDRGPAVEQFRSLRSRIYELRDVSPLKSILISSGMPQEGKSYVSANLALSLARHKNSRVLLIDGDMRRYTMHQILGCEAHPGLADYLSGNAGIVEIMQRPEQLLNPEDASKQPTMPNLTFIAGGNGGDRAADLSGSPRFGELIRLASPHFDWIIVDSSPVIPVSDAVNLARACDGVLLVARGGVTKFPVAQRAQSELKASKILGFVLNAVHEAPEVGSYYGYDANHE
jgi:protein-tyrosine kinase